MDKSIGKKWWAPVWTGLVMDGKGVHYKRMGNGIWIYLYLLLNADRRTGQLKRKTATISSDMGISERTVRKWLGILEINDYIKVKFTGHCLHICVNKWKGSARNDRATQGGTNVPGSPERSFRAEQADFCKKSQDSCRRILFSFVANDTSIKRDVLKTDIDRGNHSERCSNASAEFTPRTREELLAIDLARELDDLQALPLYLSYSKKYSESLLRSVLQEVKSLPDSKIKKSRGALFNHLVQKYGRKAS